KKHGDFSCSPQGQVAVVAQNERHLVFAGSGPNTAQFCDTRSATTSALPIEGTIRALGLAPHSNMAAFLTAGGSTRAGHRIGIESWDIARKKRIAHFDLGFDMSAKGTLSQDAELFALAFRPNAGIEGSVEVRTTATNHLVKRFVNQPYITAIAFS